ncbi:hypothetical protein [Paraburkholderia aromaticivorans]|uniref:hypothetical protein n=1 Tax=Paraburkholderia aromaticivorans TaxID=2026199 RepID=UPI0012FE4832|nr:hypothetical protein [Paraburkholderia aromaticivorans]
MAKTNARPRPYWVSALGWGCREQKWQFRCNIRFVTAQFFETLILIGFALRYHSKRREGSGSSADGRLSVRRDWSGGDPEPELLDGAARARIIGAFALFVST